MTLTITEAVNRASAWLDYPGVELVGEGQKDDRPIILVYVSVDPAQFEGVIPEMYEGYPVVMEITDSIKPHDNKSSF